MNLSENITRLDYQDKEIILIGTAHVSRESAELVKQVIEEEHPDSVCVELDEDRYHNIQNPKAWEDTDIIKVIKSKKVGFLLANLALSSYQKRIAKQLDAPVGGEMLQGIESAKEVGAALVLADRNIQTTFLRIWRKLNAWEKCKLIGSLLFSFDDDDEVSELDLQELLKADMLESVLVDMRKQFPKIGDILISERDQHLAAKIKEAPGKKVVAVLGGAHVPGVKKEIYRSQNLDEILIVPRKGIASKIAGWIIPALIIGLIFYGFVTNIQTGIQQLSVWALWNGGLAALFTAIALGHPLSILTAFVTAPFTSLNPLLACGWFAGLVQATVKKPTVQDVLNVQTDIFSVRGFFKNRFLKTLMVVVFANIGSGIGTYVAGFDIIKNLF
ncbi:TraB/GumN family protein [Sinanaerobacter sp. ZZT-01]|nr:TraB/GumN family protein [Sinanaerobacter sp. ZZT-01]WRR94329.1 TraB/GumN family protein [Sinanaerobacter sp. ZZT-01]